MFWFHAVISAMKPCNKLYKDFIPFYYNLIKHQTSAKITYLYALHQKINPSVFKSYLFFPL